MTSYGRNKNHDDEIKKNKRRPIIAPAIGAAINKKNNKTNKKICPREDGGKGKKMNKIKKITISTTIQNRAKIMLKLLKSYSPTIIIKNCYYCFCSGIHPPSTLQIYIKQKNARKEKLYNTIIQPPNKKNCKKTLLLKAARESSIA